MKNLQTFEDFINESYLNEGYKVSTKDWDRMLQLHIKNNDGSSVASKINSKEKAAARFIAGVKLSGWEEKDFDESFSKNRNRFSYNTDFGDFGDKALGLGATLDELKDFFKSTEIPKNIIDKKTQLLSKKVGNWVVGKVSEIVLKLGGDIEYIGKGGRATTREGRDAMSRSGRKWTIGYKSKITIDNKSFDFNFDAITDEGVDNNTVFYVIDSSSSNEFEFETDYKRYGITGIKKGLEKTFEKIKQ